MRPQIPAILIAFLAISRFDCLNAQDKPAKGETQTLEQRVDAIVGKQVPAGSPGCAVAVYQDGKVALAKGYGLADLERSSPNGADTVFDLGSTSKQFTAAAIGMLVIKGDVSLDDPVRKHLSDLPEAYQPVTIRHLLTHTSGIRDYIFLMTMAGAEIIDRTTAADAMTALMRQRKLGFVPGTEFDYSNSNYFLLSQVVERAAKMPLSRFIEQKIFTPLGMARSHVHDDHRRIVPGRAIAYSPQGGGKGGFNLEMSNWEQTGDGAVMTTVQDLQKWDENFYTGTVGGPKLQEFLGTRGKLASGKDLDMGYGMGLGHGTIGKLASVSHGGAWAGYRAQMIRVPEKHLTVVCLANLATLPVDGIAREIANDLLGIRKRAAPVAKTDANTEADMKRLTGDFIMMDSGSLLALKAEGNAMSLAGQGSRMQARLLPVAQGRFVFEDGSGEIRIGAAQPGKPERFTLKIGEGPALTCEAVQPWKPAAAELEALIAEYRSEESGTAISVKLAGGKLQASGSGFTDAELQPTITDRFIVNGLSLRVRRDKQGVVNGLTLDGPALGKLAFNKVNRKS